MTTDVALAPSTYTDSDHRRCGRDLRTHAANSAQFSTVALTINGVTVSWTRESGGLRWVAESGPFQESLVKTFIHGAGSMNTSEVFDMQVAARPLNSFDFPSDLAAPGTYSVQPAGENIVDLFNISVVGVTPMVDSGGFLDPYQPNRVRPRRPRTVGLGDVARRVRLCRPRSTRQTARPGFVSLRASPSPRDVNAGQAWREFAR